VRLIIEVQAIGDELFEVDLRKGVEPSLATIATATFTTLAPFSPIASRTSARTPAFSTPTALLAPLPAAVTTATLSTARTLAARLLFRWFLITLLLLVFRHSL
jgi:hypothetical protein